MKRVYKYSLAPGGCSLPVGAEPLYVAEQFGNTYLWALVDPGEQRTEQNRIAVCGTGHGVPPGARHIGSFVLDGGNFVFHVFDLGAPS